MKTLFFCRDSIKVEQLILALRIRWPGLKPMTTSEGSLGLHIIEREEPDLVILCEDLPDLGMFSTITEIRRFSDTPIIVLIDSEDEMQGIKALDLGADDYIGPNNSLMIVMVKVVALMRRVGAVYNGSNGEPIHCGDLMINPATYEVYLGSTLLRLTPTEYRLLYLMAKNRHMTLSQNFIMNAIWSDDVEAGNKVKKYIQRLRRKLSDDARNPKWIKTIHGMGYRLSPPSKEAEYETASNAA